MYDMQIIILRRLFVVYYVISSSQKVFYLPQKMSSETNLVVIHLLFVYETMTSFSKSRNPCFHVEYFILTNILFFLKLR